VNTLFRRTWVTKGKNSRTPEQNDTGDTLEEVELAMNSDLDSVKEWLLANKLSLNIEKSK
jgi:hypothetical protein